MKKKKATEQRFRGMKECSCGSMDADVLVSGEWTYFTCMICGLESKTLRLKRSAKRRMAKIKKMQEECDPVNRDASAKESATMARKMKKVAATIEARSSGPRGRFGLPVADDDGRGTRQTPVVIGKSAKKRGPKPRAIGPKSGALWCPSCEAERLHRSKYYPEWVERTCDGCGKMRAEALPEAVWVGDPGRGHVYAEKQARRLSAARESLEAAREKVERRKAQGGAARRPKGIEFLLNESQPGESGYCWQHAPEPEVSHA